MTKLIAASVLSADFSRLGEEIAALSAADILHLDLMDGHYVPNLSFGYPIIECIARLSDKPLDAHLMVTNPDFYIEGLAELGVKYFSFHQETVYHPHRVIQKLKSLGLKAGLALNPGTPLSSIMALMADLDYVLLMSVNPGFSYQSFIPSTLDKIRELSELRARYNPALLIQVDGGITNQNAAEIRSAGADILVSASYIFSSNDYTTAINTLKGL